jgi:ABC-type multidrug transport system fused ATPase/permease subunit
MSAPHAATPREPLDPERGDEPAPDGRDAPWHLIPPEVPATLRALAAERSRLETEAEARYTNRMTASEAAYRDAKKRIEARRVAELEAAHDAHSATRTAALEGYVASSNEASRKAKAERAALQARGKEQLDASDKRLSQVRWEAGTLFEANAQGEVDRHDQFQKDLAAEVETLGVIRAESDALLAAYRKYGAPTPPPPAPPEATPDDPLGALREAVSQADQQLAHLLSLRIPRGLMHGGVAWLFVIPWLFGVGPAIFFLQPVNGLIASVVGAVAVGLVLRFFLYGLARKALDGHPSGLLATLALAESLVPKAKGWDEAFHKRRTEEIHARRAEEVARGEREHAERAAQIQQARDAALHELQESTRKLLAGLEQERNRVLEEAEATLRTRVADVESRASADLQKATEEYQHHRDEATKRQRRDWAELVAFWQAGMDRLNDAVGRVDEETSRRFPAWDGPDGRLWTPAEAVPPAVRFGEVRIDLAAIPHGVAKDERLRALAPERVTLPALLTFPDRGSLLIEAPAAGRDAAMRALRGAMARFMTGLPPGKVRFTIIDPVGLGRNFAAFMHLADYSELLVNSRIWTEPQQIEQRLADLSLHMENVIQQFLRNEYANLEEYNQHAGEVAEPYRVLVVADFPSNFHDQSAQRLASIATSGARCGVYTMIAVDTEQPLPQGVRLDDLEAHAETLRWEKDRLVWKSPAFGPFPLALDTTPDDDRFTRLLHEYGEAARHANRVEVPFEVVAPPRDRWWAGSTRTGVDVPLGRSGATKLQHLKLGKGTSQHVLIAGRTGSGKSTLLHALITNSALMYSPDEVELYLIDFKKGVEFKTYAQHELPHARVIAIESEREFGLSVLQRLDEELKRRGDRFRDLNVQDLNGYRGVPGQPPMPRILLIVDEFQEFFVEDDKTAQDCALLLDRLVRQGRAFGVHVHLGSQTLGGAFSLARSTLGQMGVRVALQCSETDAHLILSEDNAAARLLTRPGEAIYNDANGMVEGNHVFQVVWLPDERKDQYLREIKALAIERGMEMPRPQIVFEGNIPSDLRKNHLLRGLLEGPAPTEVPKGPQAWLGEAVAIKDPTAAVFRRMGGNNVIVIGQDGEAARAVFLSSILSLAAQYPADGARFYLLDGTPEDDTAAGWFTRLPAMVPQALRVGSFADTGGILGELGEELVRRQEGGAAGPSTYLFVYDFSRFRDLRKQEDDFGFGGFGKRDEERTLTPAQHLAELVKEGPSLGMHTVAWFDTLNNVNRSLDRQGLREFEMRVLFQMSANDSSNLIDSPVANRLGTNRAVFASEEQGKMEKFRPYGLPPREWLDWASSRLKDRAGPAS